MLSQIQQLYYAWDISHKKSVSDDSRFTGVLSEARVDLNPHQVEAALFAFKSPLSKGAILADEVGLGKTIEAGIILSELWAENRKKILIVVPASLRNQWNIELMEKFYLPSFILDSNSLDDAKRQNIKGKSLIFICSYNFAVANADSLKKKAWDLIVFDEAHKLRNVYKKGNVMANTLRNAFQNYKKVLLTATPLQNNLKELYGLISIIDPQFFSGLDTFAEQYNAVTTRDAAKYGELKGRISHIIHRTLRKQVEEYVNFTKRTAFVQEYYPSEAEIKLYEYIGNYLMREGTYGIPKKQRPLLSLLVRKIMASSSYALAYTLERFINRLEEYKTTGEMISALSCISDDFEGDNDEYNIYNDNSLSGNYSFESLDSEIEELKKYIKMARAIGDETKALELLKALDVSFEKIKTLGGQNKALIFTESRRTQEYLLKFLSDNGYKDKVICFNGTNDSAEAKNIYRLWLMQYEGTNRISGNTVIDKKQALVDTFRDKAEIMIATEAGAEGINLQFCSLVVNYDMPWNPQRIEQRIGRCHRYGQKNDVVVVNFVNQANYADCRVYKLLRDKFSLFDGVFGASDEVLGSMDSGVDFERKLNTIYNTCRTEREIAAAFDDLQKELESIIKERIESTRKSLLENFDEEVVNKLRMRQYEDAERMDSYNRHLWKIAINVLKKDISNVDKTQHIFTLDKSLAEDIPAGTYILNRESDKYVQLRYGHPLGQYIINKAISTNISDYKLVFDLDSYPFRSALVEQYKGESGIACVYRVSSSNKYDSEEYLIGCAKTNKGERLPKEFVFKLLEIECVNETETNLDVADDLFKAEYEKQLLENQQIIEERTNQYVDYEINKYEMWADDQLVPSQKEVMELSREHDALRRQIRKEHNATIKLQLKKEENQISRLLSHKRVQMYAMEDEYHDKVDKMTEKLQSEMKNVIHSKVMFRFKWHIM
ncbi:MAG: DEAD/DEAH box helicase [Parabacteroides sp.]|nr:DEAD/DEAH box helicase [Parabacteroides sp.]